MYKIVRLLCKYVCVMSLLLTVYFVFTATPILVVIFGVNTGLFWLCMKFFEVAISTNKARATLMHELGDNDYDKESE